MKSSNKYITNVFTTGFLVLLLLSILLFWARWLPDAIFRDETRCEPVQIVPSGLVPAEIENDPNVVQPSHVQASIMWNAIPLALGVLRDVEAERKHRSRLGASSIYHVTQKRDKNNKYVWDVIYFDEKPGLFVYCSASPEMVAGKRRWVKKIHWYAGPDGISEKPEKTLGRFTKPLTDKLGYYGKGTTIYDRRLRRFFRIDFQGKTVVKGHELSKECLPIQIGQLVKNPHALGGFNCSPPMRKATQEDEKDKRKTRDTTWDREGKRIRLVAVSGRMGTYGSRKYTLVLDESGQIYKLDTETLELSGPVGRLPSPPPFGRAWSAKPRDLFAYRVLIFHIDEEYAGTISAALSRDALGLAVSVFDKNGKLIHGDPTVYRGRAVLMPWNYTRATSIEWREEPGGLAAMITKYILENLQPAALGLASCFTASSFEATAGYRALFILPNSFVGIVSRNAGGSVIGRFFLALATISPSIILGMLLALRIKKDAAVAGLSKQAKFYWMAGTIAFGLSAYITYRLTRPKITLVTCLNCGKLRRPDMATCHRCGSKWHVPELTPPAWRVINND